MTSRVLQTTAAKLLLCLATIFPTFLSAQITEKLIFQFDGYAGGSYPIDRPVFDKRGNIYGVTQLGGTYNGGIAFELTRGSSGVWQETVLHNFGAALDGAYPSGELTLGPSGNLYGTTQIGGTQGCYQNQCGTVFSLSKKNGVWTETILHTFDYYHGSVPVGGVILDQSGNLYGVTTYGGKEWGAIFELKRMAGSWKFAVLHDFRGSDGSSPVGGLAEDTKGNLWGVTQYGGTHNDGTVFELTPSGEGWTFQSIYDFQGGNDGIAPSGRLLSDPAGDLFGLTVLGGSGKCTGERRCGTVFQLSSSGGAWTEKVVNSFTGGKDGAMPENSDLVEDGAGNLYGTTSDGGEAHGPNGYGVVFKLVPAQGSWTETVLHTFPGSGQDGFVPMAG